VTPRERVAETIYRASLCLDARDFDGFLALCAPDLRYTIETFSPEIRRPMIWLDHDRAGLAALFRNLPRHHSDHAPLTRHVSVYTVAIDDAGRTASAVSALQVFRTELDGGASALFAVGKILDVVRIDGGQAWLARRTIKLDTRLLGIGTHIPL
jgi:methanesulfonate monooxygenase small subunit